jgi:cyclopropane-fatty-acyl-phospholipid synthase
MDRVLRFALSRFVRRGSLTLLTARGTQLIFGDGTAPKVTMRFADPAAERLFLWDPELKLGELFMDGGIVIEEGSIYDFFQLVMQDSGGDRSKLPVQLNRRLRSIVRWLRTENRLGEAKQNVAHHYDLDERLYGLFPTRTASTPVPTSSTRTRVSRTPSSRRSATSPRSS